MNAKKREFFRFVAALLAIPVDLILLLPFILLSLASRGSARKIQVGLGPEGLINNVYFKKALSLMGYSAETFAFTGNYITHDFDICPDANVIVLFFLPYYFFLRVLFRYKVLFIYFNGGPLGRMPILKVLEPFLYKLAGVRVVALPYGSDVQVMHRSKNLFFKHTMNLDYPMLGKRHRETIKKIDRWTTHADWIISGNDWVDYMYYWDTLLSGHWCIDLQQWTPSSSPRAETKTLRILHAPNHINIKGTPALMQAVEQVKREGLDVELIVLSKVTNSTIREVMQTVDIVADQFVMGWYALFAIEAMALEKPVLCYLRDDLMNLFVNAGLMTKDELPIINTPYNEISEKLRWVYTNKEKLAEIGKRGREYVSKHHSLEYMGGVFKEILTRLGESPGS